MDIILKEDIDQLGSKNDIVTVKTGYAMNTTADTHNFDCLIVGVGAPTATCERRNAVNTGHAAPDW